MTYAEAKEAAAFCGLRLDAVDAGEVTYYVLWFEQDHVLAKGTLDTVMIVPFHLALAEMERMRFVHGLG